MLASLDWLGEFVEISDLKPGRVAEMFVTLGLEVERLYDHREYLNGVAAGRLVEVKPHGNLSLCRLDIGDGAGATVLCGAKNLEPGKIYPYAKPGTELPGGTIKTMTVMGVTSSGMLASSRELLLGEDNLGIMELGPKVMGDRPVGTPLSVLFPAHDWIMEIGVTPNRGDALCHLGLARDLAAFSGRPLKSGFFPLEEEGIRAEEQVRVRVDSPEGCHRYCGRVINDAKPGPSPLWVEARLASLGQRSVNNIVDVTNYVMLELGLPLHAFDLKTISTGTISVRFFPKGTKFTTLDGQERELASEETLLICDGDKPVGIAGIMGGRNSEIADETRDIFLEGAWFNPVSIRRSSKALGLSTEASIRFERGQDIEMCPRAVDRAASMMSSVSCGKVAPGRLDEYPKPRGTKICSFSPARCDAYLGTNHGSAESRRALADLGFELREPESPKKKGKDKTKGGKPESAAETGSGAEAPALSDEWVATIPSWRTDVTREVDLYEEVMRILDLGNLPATLPVPPGPAAPDPPTLRLAEKIRSRMTGLGFMELMSYSFLNGNFVDKLLLAPDDPARTGAVRILNPLSEEQNTLRTLILPSLLNAAKLNQYHNRRDLRLFEIGAVFLKKGENVQPFEKRRFGALIAKDRDSVLWNEEKRPVDFFDLKGVLEALATGFGEVWEYVGDEFVPPFLDRREAASVIRGGKRLGWLGLLSGAAAANHGLKKAGGPVYVLELDLGDLSVERVPVFREFSEYPELTRDLAVLVDSETPAAELVKTIKETGDIPPGEVSVFDLYTGDKVPEGKKSVAFRLRFRSFERTLTEEIVSGCFRRILEALGTRHGARLRD
ncbi:MAG: phenylalanine--tRNA ligase subunit beta [Deltaproteobacteria bacterium]|jgi:phenylalanyl-tRNA synthetase beta chain|nr:phenylalanine--tRNA ligase subunit beta [Deltaproteobacteria bacterium]